MQMDDDDDGTKIFQAICLMMSADSEWYLGIWNDPKNITLLGTDIYPKTTTDVYNILRC